MLKALADKESAIRSIDNNSLSVDLSICSGGSPDFSNVLQVPMSVRHWSMLPTTLSILAS